MEWRLASRWAGYDWETFMALPGTMRWMDAFGVWDCKAMVLASYRVARDLEDMQRAGQWD